ncbi:Lipoprotein-releasing system transmembrane protein lolC [Serratia rubidaea]|uniref:Lipoprotein-releasing system transmembrane protein lolC n=1 Tax=Serratia rubidaea TaxID=61652 RepID=A0A3S4I4K6_SERRU|nr:Lipoprotein-releasing system transmembrane protein lolC [Serratia rubidaea]
MYQPVALFIGLRYMRGRASDRFGRFVSWLSTIGITLGVMALVTVLSVMNGFERDLENNILGLMPQALVTTRAGRSILNGYRPLRCRGCRASPAWPR